MTDFRFDVLKASFTQTIGGVPVATTFKDVIDPSTGAAFQPPIL